VRLGDFATAYFGIQTFRRETYVAAKARTSRHKPAIDGANIDRFYVHPATEFVDFRPSAIKSGGNPDVYDKPRIGVRQIGETPIAALLPAGLLTLNTVYNIYLTRPTQYDLRFVLAVILSTPLRWYWRQTSFDQKQTFPKIKKDALLNIPVPRIDFGNGLQLSGHDRVVKLVDDVMAAKMRSAASRVASTKDALDQRAASIEAQIDAALARMWGLTPTQTAEGVCPDSS